MGDLFILNLLTLKAPGCTYQYSSNTPDRINKRTKKGGSNGKLEILLFRNWFPVQQFYKTVLFFRLETSLEFVFSLLVSVSYSNKKRC